MPERCRDAQPLDFVRPTIAEGLSGRDTAASTRQDALRMAQEAQADTSPSPFALDEKSFETTR
jgi:hypothetical protein